MAAGFLRKIWDFEVTATKAVTFRWVPAWAILTMVIYVIMEVVVLAPATVISISAYLDLRQRGFGTAHAYDFTVQVFPWAFLVLMTVNVCFRVYIGLDGYFIGRRDRVDRGQFYRNLLVYNPASVMGLMLHFLIGVLLGCVLWGLGWRFQDGFDFILRSGAELRLWLQSHIPTLVAMPYKWMAILLAVTLYSFAGFFEHWLSHKSRFLWHVVHAPHHLPDMLHPIGSPLANSFEIFLIPVRVVLGAALTKLVYAEPLLLESALFALASYCFEIFNHSSAHYEFNAGSRILRFISKLGGGQGAHHYLHHSSAKQHQTVNVGPGIWLIWDRIFGTFEEPPLEKPAVGWTDNPDIHHNPFRVLFGGPARILYELRHNKGFGVRMKILLGSVMWNPPVTVDYLKKEKQAAAGGE